MPISVANKHLAGNSTFSAPSNPGWGGAEGAGGGMTGKPCTAVQVTPCAKGTPFPAWPLLTGCVLQQRSSRWQ